jgi:hypothetical protein
MKTGGKQQAQIATQPSSEQHLVPNTTQSTQSKLVEFENSLYMRKPHLDFPAFAARLLERFGVGKSANAQLDPVCPRG